MSDELDLALETYRLFFDRADEVLARARTAYDQATISFRIAEAALNGFRAAYDLVNGDRQRLEPNTDTAPEDAPSDKPGRTRTDVRGPVIDIARARGELSFDDAVAALPQLKPSSIRAALKAAVADGTLVLENGVYAVPESASTVEEGEHEAGGNGSGTRPEPASPPRLSSAELADLAGRMKMPEPDPRMLASASLDDQLAALREALLRCRKRGHTLWACDSFISPEAIEAAIEAGWCHRDGEGDEAELSFIGPSPSLDDQLAALRDALWLSGRHPSLDDQLAALRQALSMCHQHGVALLAISSFFGSEVIEAAIAAGWCRSDGEGEGTELSLVAEPE